MVHLGFSFGQEHSGSLRAGHYTAIAQNSDNKQWYSFNDTHVSETGEWACPVHTEGAIMEAVCFGWCLSFIGSVTHDTPNRNKIDVLIICLVFICIQSKIRFVTIRSSVVVPINLVLGGC